MFYMSVILQLADHRQCNGSLRILCGRDRDVMRVKCYCSHTAKQKLILSRFRMTEVVVGKVTPQITALWR